MDPLYYDENNLKFYHPTDLYSPGFLKSSMVGWDISSSVLIYLQE